MSQQYLPPMVPENAPVTIRKPAPENKRSLLLSNEENQSIFDILGKGRQTLSTAVAQLLVPTPDQQRWQIKDTGALCLVRDTTKKSYFIQAISLRTKSMVFRQEVYNQFDYTMPQPWFLTFEGDSSMVGINFADRVEASNFKDVLDNKLESKRQRRYERRSRVIENQNFVQPPQPPNLAYSASDRKVPNGTGTTITSTYNFPTKKESKKQIKAKAKDKKKLFRKEDIGNPMNFRHVQHVGWDPARGFDLAGVDKDFEAFFQKAGVSHNQLEDEGTREFIYNFIETHGGMEAIKQEVTGGRPAPPPPSIHQTGPNYPPPPIPARQTQPPKPPYPRKASLKSTQLLHQTNTLPSPTFQNKVAIQPIRQNETPPPPPPPNAHGMSGNKIQAPPPPPLVNSKNTAPPPPPPPPPLGPPPAPVGKPSSVTDSPGESRKLPPVEDERSALMKQIQEGRKLKKVDVEPAGKKLGGGLLLDQIKVGVDLRKVSDTARPAPSLDTMDGLAGALARALAERKGAINPDTSGSESDNDEYDAFDEDEWE